ncbi:hypothetical protein psal_cds_440 [Pandoravirus salinus]|uniref:Uncharacterized protein n=1 Tax=Pandoravirus salinus TaxID=1349410 RepID=S4VUG6_9VIRU|nr:hypothetical protein psal_cds_440 [Pandoravirus salinus]AGO84189.1 hypothetical protein psal_cds_440 [Pandoravirus salinus]
MGAHASTASPRRSLPGSLAPATGAPTSAHAARHASRDRSCSPGDCVILGGAALDHARDRHLCHVATVVGHDTADKGRPMVRLCLYADAPVAQPGGVGRPVEEILVPAGDAALVRPLPIHLYAVAPDEVKQRAAAFWAWTDALSKAVGDDATTDPDRRLQAACACPSGVRDADPVTAHGRLPLGGYVRGGIDRDRVLSIITAHTPEGVTRRTTLVHDGNGAQAETAGARDPARCARPVVITTTGLPGGIARYGIAPLSPARTVQSAALCAYGLPLAPAFYQAVEWDRWPDYAQLVDEAAARHAAAAAHRDAATDAVGVDSVWLYRLVSDLVDRGYRVSPVDLGAATV